MVYQQLALWDAAGTQVGCATYVAAQGTVTLQSNSLTPGQNYWISVDDNNTPGTFSLCVTNQIDYDFKDGAVLLSNTNNWCSADAEYSNTFATADESLGSCWNGALNKNVWFTFNATTSFIKVSVKTGGGFGSMVYQQLALWNSAGTQVGCATYVAAQGTVTLQSNSLTPGQNYWISVDDNNTPELSAYV
ncbi:MAG: hypothetical protein IPN68_16860 [Bacteroidetes bacterium]|nr:hypothetical protein [Bacteroidota bacterium]